MHSDFRNLLVSHLHDVLLQLPLPVLLKVEIAFVVFGKPVRIAIYVSALALNPKQAHLLFTREASSFLLLLSLCLPIF